MTRDDIDKQSAIDELATAARIVLTALEQADIWQDTQIWAEERDLLWQALERVEGRSPRGSSPSSEALPVTNAPHAFVLCGG